MAGNADEDGHRSDAQIEGDFRRDALRGDADASPRFGLRQVHLRIGHRFISIWWLLPGIALLGTAIVVAFKLFITGTSSSTSCSWSTGWCSSP